MTFDLWQPFDDSPDPSPLRAAVVGLAAALVVALCIQSCGAERIVYTVFGEDIPPVRHDDALFASHLYLAAVDPDTRLPRWVAYRVEGAWQYGRNEIGRNWWSPNRDVLLESADYEYSMFDMGHLAPISSFRASPFASELNWTCNVIPQRPKLNRGAWLQLEDYIRGLALTHQSVDVVCGPLFQDVMLQLPSADEPHRVPSHCWKRIRYGDGPTVRQWIFPQETEGKEWREFEVDSAEFSERVKLE